MWLSNSSVGRKVVMALTGAFLVLFLTFHCLMNAVAILWPAAYNSVCEFLGANWYALAASVGLAAFFIIHIIYAVVLTIQNRRARGSIRYAVSKTPKSVEWSSKNMLVLGIVIVAFLVVHMVQFWAKMQLAEIVGSEGAIPPAAGTLFIQEAFSQFWTPIVYLIAFVALWFHLNHGFWSMFQSMGWDNNVWIPRWKKIGCAWVSIVIALFVIQIGVFTYRASTNYYIQNEDLREQYKNMIWPMISEDFGPDMAQLGSQIESLPYSQVSQGLRQMKDGINQQLEQLNSPEGKEYVKNNPQMQEQLETQKKQLKGLEKAVKLLDMLEANDNNPEAITIPGAGAVNPQ